MHLGAKVQADKVVGWLKDMSARGRDLTPAMADFGQYMRNSARENFLRGGRPTWRPLKEATVHAWAGSRKTWTGKSGSYTQAGRAAVAGRKPLVASGRLMNSISPRHTARSMTLSTTVKYARVHQYGGSTGPRTIVPRTKKALFWPGAAHPVKSVRHPGSKIPARPYLVFQPEDLAYLQRRLPGWVIEGR